MERKEIINTFKKDNNYRVASKYEAKIKLNTCFYCCKQKMSSVSKANGYQTKLYCQACPEHFITGKKYTCNINPFNT